MELLSSMVKKQGRELEPVLPLIFYNGKEKWEPQKLGELFQEHPYYAILEPYIPDFRFLFQDAARLSPAALLELVGVLLLERTQPNFILIEAR